MRIGYLTYGLDRNPTGIGRYTIELLCALDTLPHSHEIVLLTTERHDLHGLWQRFEHHALPGCRLLPALLTIGHGMFSHAIQRYRLDIVHDPNGVAPFLGPRMQACRIVTLHDAFPYVYPDEHTRLDNWRYRHQLPDAAQQADAVITVSACSRHDLIRYLDLSAQKLHVIAEGVNPRFQPIADCAERQAVLARYSIQQPYLLYVGGINARKNITRLLEAFAGLLECHSNLKLVIVGKRQWQVGEIDATLQRLKLSAHVHFTGYIDESDLPALYSAAEVFVFPSLYEGFGLPPLEAMACGTPVITSNTSALPEIVADAALTVDPHDVEGLEAVVEQLLTDKPLRSDLRWRGIQRASQFTWMRAARETLALYERVLRSAPAAPDDDLDRLRIEKRNSEK